MTGWIVVIGLAALLTAAGAYAGMHPLLAAFCAPVVASLLIQFAIGGPTKDAFWGLAALTTSICSLPVTITAAIVTDNLLDKYSSRRRG